MPDVWIDDASEYCGILTCRDTDCDSGELLCFSARRPHPTPPGCGARQPAHHSTSHMGEQGFTFKGSYVCINSDFVQANANLGATDHDGRTCVSHARSSGAMVWSHFLFFLGICWASLWDNLTSQDVVSLLLAAGCPESAPGGTLPRRRGSGEMRHRGGKEVFWFKELHFFGWLTLSLSRLPPVYSEIWLGCEEDEALTFMLMLRPLWHSVTVTNHQCVRGLFL